jgi:hypothetical protein
MKKVLILICLSITISIISFGQSNKKKEKYLNSKANKYTNEIVEYVKDITIDQRNLIFEINKTVAIKFDSLYALELEYEESKPLRIEIYKYKDDELKKILTTVQYDEYLMLKEENKQKSAEKRKQKTASND